MVELTGAVKAPIGAAGTSVAPLFTLAMLCAVFEDVGVAEASIAIVALGTAITALLAAVMPEAVLKAGWGVNAPVEAVGVSVSALLTAVRRGQRSGLGGNLG